MILLNSRERNPLQMQQDNSFHYALLVEYDGAGFHGFQFQNNARTIQEELEKAIFTILRDSVRIQFCGRTDSGVHATGQIISFVSRSEVERSEKFIHSMNAILPSDVAVREFFSVPAGFHPRFSCIAREYEYLIYNGKTRPLHLRPYTHWFRGKIPLEEIQNELNSMTGERDWASFTRMEYRTENTMRYVDQISISRIADSLSRTDSLLALRIRGNAFLHNMIRILAGTVLDRSKGKLKKSLLEILEDKNRLSAGSTAPPQGLYFRHAYYGSAFANTGLQILENYPTFRKD